MKRQIVKILLLVVSVAGVLGVGGYQAYWGYFQHLNSEYNKMVYTEDYNTKPIEDLRDR